MRNVASALCLLVLRVDRSSGWRVVSAEIVVGDVTFCIISGRLAGFDGVASSSAVRISHLALDLPTARGEVRQ